MAMVFEQCRIQSVGDQRNRRRKIYNNRGIRPAGVQGRFAELSAKAVEYEKMLADTIAENETHNFHRCQGV
jgi:hypothetical protein